MYMLTPLQPTTTAFPLVFTRNKCICPTCQKAQWSVNIAAFLKTEKGCCERKMLLAELQFVLKTIFH